MKNELKNIVDNEMLLKRIDDLTKRLEEKEAKAEKPVKVEIDVNKFQKDSAKWNANFFLIVFPILFVLVYIMSSVGGARWKTKNC